MSTISKLNPSAQILYNRAETQQQSQQQQRRYSYFTKSSTFQSGKSPPPWTLRAWLPWFMNSRQWPEAALIELGRKRKGVARRLAQSYSTHSVSRASSELVSVYPLYPPTPNLNPHIKWVCCATCTPPMCRIPPLQPDPCFRRPYPLIPLSIPPIQQVSRHLGIWGCSLTGVIGTSS
jgi:hypothetical protein